MRDNDLTLRVVLLMGTALLFALGAWAQQEDEFVATVSVGPVIGVAIVIMIGAVALIAVHRVIAPREGPEERQDVERGVKDISPPSECGGIGRLVYFILVLSVWVWHFSFFVINDARGWLSIKMVPDAGVVAVVLLILLTWQRMENIGLHSGWGVAMFIALLVLPLIVLPLGSSAAIRILSWGPVAELFIFVPSVIIPSGYYGKKR